MLVEFTGHSPFLRQGEHTLFVAAVQLTSVYLWPITHSGAQVAQALCPVELAYVPAAHALHSVLPSVLLDRVPIGHAAHALLAASWAYVPAAHSVHAELAALPEYDPAAQAPHAVWPTDGAAYPAWHAEQLAAPDAPLA